MVSGASTAALVSEEKGPSLVSQYQALAPEEVGGRSKGTFKLKEERTTAEIKRDRRAIKQKIKGILDLYWCISQIKGIIIIFVYIRVTINRSHFIAI